jgi:hypothetical protein
MDLRPPADLHESNDDVRVSADGRRPRLRVRRSRAATGTPASCTAFASFAVWHPFRKTTCSGPPWHAPRAPNIFAIAAGSSPMICATRDDVFISNGPQFNVRKAAPTWPHAPTKARVVPPPGSGRSPCPENKSIRGMRTVSSALTPSGETFFAAEAEWSAHTKCGERLVRIRAAQSGAWACMSGPRHAHQCAPGHQMRQMRLAPPSPRSVGMPCRLGTRL